MMSDNLVKSIVVPYCGYNSNHAFFLKKLYSFNNLQGKFFLIPTFDLTDASLAFDFIKNNPSPLLIVSGDLSSGTYFPNSNPNSNIPVSANFVNRIKEIHSSSVNVAVVFDSRKFNHSNVYFASGAGGVFDLKNNKHLPSFYNYVRDVLRDYSFK